MALERIIPLTLYGQEITGLSVGIGESAKWDLTIEKPDTRLPQDLTGIAVVMEWRKLDLLGFPTGSPIFSRQATVTSSSGGLCYIRQAPSDTVPSGVPFAPGKYGVDVWLADINGDRLRTLMFTVIDLKPAVGLPGDPVTPLPTEPPLGTGPQGIPGPGTLDGIGSEVLIGAGQACNLTKRLTIWGPNNTDQSIALPNGTIDGMRHAITAVLFGPDDASRCTVTGTLFATPIPAPTVGDGTIATWDFQWSATLGVWFPLYAYYRSRQIRVSVEADLSAYNASVYEGWTAFAFTDDKYFFSDGSTWRSVPTEAP